MFNTLDFIALRLKNNNIEVLLRKRLDKNKPEYGTYTIVAGMIKERTSDNDYFDKNIEDAANRILKEKIGIIPSYIEPVNPEGSYNRDSHGWSITLPYICFFNDEDNTKFDGNEIFKWISLDSILNNEHILPFDHSLLVKKAYETLVNKSRYSSVLFYLLPKEFIISDVVKLFEIFNLKVSKQTISNRWVKSNLIKENGKYIQNKKGGKPASLFELVEKELSYFEVSLSKLNN